MGISSFWTLGTYKFWRCLGIWSAFRGIGMDGYSCFAVLWTAKLSNASLHSEAGAIAIAHGDGRISSGKRKGKSKNITLLLLMFQVKNV